MRRAWRAAGASAIMLGLFTHPRSTPVGGDPDAAAPSVVKTTIPEDRLVIRGGINGLKALDPAPPVQSSAVNANIAVEVEPPAEFIAEAPLLYASRGVLQIDFSDTKRVGSFEGLRSPLEHSVAGSGGFSERFFALAVDASDLLLLATGSLGDVLGIFHGPIVTNRRGIFATAELPGIAVTPTEDRFAIARVDLTSELSSPFLFFGAFGMLCLVWSGRRNWAPVNY